MRNYEPVGITNIWLTIVGANTSIGTFLITQGDKRSKKNRKFYCQKECIEKKKKELLKSTGLKRWWGGNKHIGMGGVGTGYKRTIEPAQ